MLYSVEKWPLPGISCLMNLNLQLLSCMNIACTQANHVQSWDVMSIRYHDMTKHVSYGYVNNAAAARGRFDLRILAWLSYVLS